MQRSADIKFYRMTGLDLVRTMAILLVLIGHGRYFLAPSIPFFQNWNGGLLGVDLFFALSGYLIGGVYIETLNKSASVQVFLIRRWLRTIPNYYLFLATHFVVFGTFSFSYVIFFQNFLSNDIFYFHESWSLAVEEIFYLALPFVGALVLLAGKLLNRRLSGETIAMITAILLILFSVSFRAHFALSNVLSPETYDNDLRKIVLFRLDAIGFGVLCIALENKFFRNFTLTKSAIFSCISLIAALYIVNFTVAKNEDAIISISYVTVVAIVFAGSLPVFKRLQFPETIARALKITAALAYSLYLCHTLVMGLVETVLTDRFGMDRNLTGDGIVMWSVWMIFSFGTAYIIYRYFERPFLRIRDKYFPHNK